MPHCPIVSVIIPVYNCGRYLCDALKTVAQQTFTDFEVIIMDDGSTDKSSEVCQRFQANDPRFRYFRQDNAGISSALNKSIVMAKGQFLARFDGDDLNRSHRFAQQVAYLRDHPRTVACGSAVQFIDPEDRPLKIYRPPQEDESIRRELRNGNGGSLVHPSLMARKEAIIACGMYRPQYNFVEDLDLYIRLSKFGKLANLECICLDYRMQPRSTNHTKKTEQASLRSQLMRESFGERVAVASNSLPQPAQPHHAQWAYFAIEGGHRRTALLHAALGFLKHPRHRECQKALAYAIRKCVAR